MLGSLFAAFELRYLPFETLDDLPRTQQDRLLDLKFFARDKPQALKSPLQNGPHVLLYVLSELRWNRGPRCGRQLI